MVMIVDSKIVTLKKQHLIAGHTVSLEKYNTYEEAYRRRIDDTIKPDEILPDLMRTYTNYVMLDKKSFKPINLENLMQEKVKLDEFEPVSVRVPEKLIKKGPVFKTTRTVENSDIDENFHMNQSNYLKWCMDSYAQYKNSCSEGKFYDILSDYSFSKIDMQHIQEAMIYQKCDIYIF